MALGLRNTRTLLAVLAVAGLLLTGCGSSGKEEAGLSTSTGTTGATPQKSAGATASAAPERYDISVLMVCTTMEAALAKAGKATPRKAANIMGKALAAAFRGSTTPDARFTDVDLDKMMRSGCPGLHADALQSARLVTLADLPQS